ncbi:MAG: T9SS type A sorting domain-containing protein [Bacteroidetes bacterium]|nr:T9SS type A sorting domain-containing protein [Bacteroidota bacterium]
MKNTMGCLFLAFPIFLLAQNDPPFEYDESPDDPYHYIPRAGRATSPPYRLDGTLFSIRQVNVDDAGQNILGDAANEPSLVIDPTNPDRMAIGWRQFDTIANNFRQAGYAFTFDAGENWHFPEPIEAGVFRSDPVLDADSEGNFYYNSLTIDANNEYVCQVFKSEAGSNTWGTGVDAHGGDKQWMTIDRTDGATNGNIYAFWKTNISSCIGGFTRSLDHGETYLPCEQLIDDPTRGTLVVSPTGELFACGGGPSGGFIVLKSDDPGIMGQSLTWNLVQQVNMGGNLAIYDGPNPSGMLGQAWIDVDNSGGTTQGNVYLLATVADIIDPANIKLSRSTDGGLTWEDPIRINDDQDPDGLNWQWFGSLSVAPNGRIDVTWFDTRDNPGTYLSRLYYSYSADGGHTWSANEALSEAFDPHLGWPQQQKIGDYNHQRSDNVAAHLAWAATFNGEEDVYYSHIMPDISSGTSLVESHKNTVGCSPNPFSSGTNFHFSLQKAANIRLDIFDSQGHQIESIQPGEQPAGSNTEYWESNEVRAGLYFYQLLADGVLIGDGKLLKI